jgi:hypothetical protein
MSEPSHDKFEQTMEKANNLEPIVSPHDYTTFTGVIELTDGLKSKEKTFREWSL